MRLVRLRVIAAAGLVGVACASPAAPTPADPGPPAAPPQAVLSVHSDVTPALAISGYTPLVFDGLKSTGSQLAYRLEFEDGARVSSPVATHVDMTDGLRTATLTVTDRLGRADVASVDYYVATLGRGNGTWWNYFTDGGAVRLFLSNSGAAITGFYNGPEVPFGTSSAIEGTLSGERTVSLDVDGGRVTFEGSLQWRSSGLPNVGQPTLRLRLTARGGPLDGQTVEFTFADPY